MENNGLCKGETEWPRHLLLLSFALLNMAISVSFHRELKELELSQEMIIKQVNVTGNSNEKVIFFNRVPKAGSSSFVVVLKELSHRNNFTSYGFRISEDGMDVEIKSMSDAEQNDTAKYISTTCEEQGESCGFYKHMFFINYEKYGLRNPVYINFVRHPVDRIQSWYYYVRSASYIYNSTETMSIWRLKGTLDDCIMGRWRCDISLKSVNWIDSILSREPDLMKQLSKLDISRIVTSQGDAAAAEGEEKFDKSKQGDEVSSQIAYFCGYGEMCSSDEPENAFNRLQIAMGNVERYYSVVGVLEEMDKSLSVFENYVPRYFKGVREVSKQEVNTNKPKPELSAEARTLLEKYLEYEIVFYEFCRQRLHMQYMAVA